MKKIALLGLSISLACSSFSQQQTVGLFQNTPEAMDAYTLFAPMSDTMTYLIDNCGEKVHSWVSSYRPAASVYLLENGNLLRTRSANKPNFSTGGSGGEIEILDWDGNVIWEYELATDSSCSHHDIQPLPNGNILAIMWEAFSMGKAIHAGREMVGSELWSEKIVEIEPDIANGGGKIVWEWRAWDHLVQEYDNTKPNYGVVANSPHRINLNYSPINPSAKDWLHFNSVAYNEKLDQIVISVHSFSELWVIDHSTTTAEAASSFGGKQLKGGDILYRWGNPAAYDQGSMADQKLFRQHDVHWIDETFKDGGKLIVFNNQAGEPMDYSQVNIIATPVDTSGAYTLNGSTYGPGSFDWTYQADTATNFFSGIISGASRLKNGNTLMCEGVPGRFTEVDENGKTVWQYVNPVTNNGPVAQGTPPIQNMVFRCHKYPAYYPAFKGKTLTQQGYLESGSTFSCQLYPNSVSPIAELQNIRVYPNPFNSEVKIQAQESIESVSVYSSLGQQVFFKTEVDSDTKLDLSHLEKGTYFLIIRNTRGGLIKERITKF